MIGSAGAGAASWFAPSLGESNCRPTIAEREDAMTPSTEHGGIRFMGAVLVAWMTLAYIPVRWSDAKLAIVSMVRQAGSRKRVTATGS